MKFVMPRFDKAQVLVVGDLMLDRYWHGPTSRISPEAPVPVVKVEQNEDRPGGAANVALNISALGAGVSLIGLVGEDEAGSALETQLTSARVNCQFCVSSNEPTITKLRVMSRHQQLIRLDFEEPFAADYSEALQQQADTLLSNVGVMILSDYNKGTLSDPQALIAQAKAAGVPVLVDPKGSNFDRYRGATLLTPNLSEFEGVVGACASEQELVNKAQQLIEHLELEALLVTRSEQGMTLIRAGQGEVHFPARAREVFDVTGAGDTVISTLASALAAGEPLEVATGLANMAASIVVGKLGTAAISAPELRRTVNRELGAERGVVSDEQLLVALDDARASGEKIVFTNGCFDILHAGHVGYLKQARAQGDRLVLAINDDDSVKRLKGEGRPINPVERRKAVLAGLEAVDWVVSFNEDTPERLLEQVRPDVLVKGGDYGIEGVVGGEFVRSYGGEVKVLSFLDNCSTTAIVEKIQNSDD
ncbi:bifunctional D-glycero-beta-D-manno-heptose-7-phosphate kinase/D-glycero-beta-D-manno-heptose 1-phosphate adenylyltransferase HldE [Aliamphritea spongicola]|uniref:bifunctional D-glycero-beta-D-manno-heptose-7-phosphate kinase/D-glycero-beta-D-manno-heptose 1-phosphate adenylyltransferase HldE n=1 Tax=Aliamphritea spongicola TaxID=707589 RepID=UPI00196A3A11|nr:bifunctional D-glycero-beta-D-manno-heptose-7-phosphate kinase/D-glycero-beta-D-manno-heptose 1-phosphate adenylyltransferase HldE [Aliamphritea spongicola]MBN3562413.1 bifunctional D-glycero-beta-D-manno-heptose-7-phosphate kinase/D-glycero-beta-D-manno-heptose 1-phosphate adenylyltransferase HldE [Aliamphritea spongicola]